MLPPSALFTVDSFPLHWQKGELTQIMTVENLVNTTQRDTSIYPKMSSSVIQVPSRVLALAGQGEGVFLGAGKTMYLLTASFRYFSVCFSYIWQAILT